MPQETTARGEIRDISAAGRHRPRWSLRRLFGVRRGEPPQPVNRRPAQARAADAPVPSGEDRNSAERVRDLESRITALKDQVTRAQQQIAQLQQQLRDRPDAPAVTFVSPPESPPSPRPPAAKEGPATDVPRSSDPRPVRDAAEGDQPLYAWQRDALGSWREHQHRGIVQAVTGTGKTRVGLAAIDSARRARRRAVVLVPTLALKQQWELAIVQHLPSAELRGPGGTGRWDVRVETIQSALRRPPYLGQGGLVVADECHRCGAPAFSRALHEEYAWRLGLTATLKRGDGGDDVVAGYFGGVCFDLGYQRAVADALIAPFKFALASVPLTAAERAEYDDLAADLTSARRSLVTKFGLPESPAADFLTAVGLLAQDRTYGSGGGLARKYLAQFTQRKKLLAETPAKTRVLAALAPVVRASGGTIVFTQTTQASNEAAAALSDEGCIAAAVHSGLDSDERDQRLELLRCGAGVAVSAPRILDEGIDVPDADLGVIMASSRSRRQLIQRLGRVLRRRPGKTARFVVLYAENTVEDPHATGYMPDFYEDCLPWARDVGHFELGAGDLPKLLAFLGVGAGEGNKRSPAERSDTGLLESTRGRRAGYPRERSPRRSVTLVHRPVVRAQPAGAGATVDPVTCYLTQISRVPLLTAAQEVELAKRIEAGLFAEHRLETEEALSPADLHDLRWIAGDGRAAKNRMVEANLRLVVSLAKHYRTRRMEFLDLIQEGNIGLIHAVEKFDYTKGNKFSTYATWWIKQAITRSIGDQDRTIRIPVHVDEVVGQITRTQRQMFEDLGRPPTADELAEHLGLTPEKIHETLDRVRDPLSLDAPADADGTALGELLEGSDAQDLETSVTFTCLRDTLRATLSTLPKREAGIVAMRFGIDGGGPRTLEEIGRNYGVTRERIRQIERDALAKLAQPALSQPLRDYLDELALV